MKLEVAPGFLLFTPAITVADSEFTVQSITTTKDLSGETGTCADSRIKFDSALINGDGNIDAMNRAYSALTAALVSNSKIDVWADDTSDCESATSIDILD
ncbi:DUF5992 family protein [Microbulbifer sp. VAAF005]|uniref:DUF5992 family protein n=1 Tax=Microbulbifer sp. VAAF005 TaxID=3034230 RepID=UPI0024AE6E31|nr:DUF5992 family protein [Microbulbifer sp. VAAF005]WHI47989.1 DUF5992 family protein [Microbulbifer sp. VAAF005]